MSGTATCLLTVRNYMGQNRQLKVQHASGRTESKEKAKNFRLTDAAAAVLL